MELMEPSKVHVPVDDPQRPQPRRREVEKLEKQLEDRYAESLQWKEVRLFNLH